MEKIFKKLDEQYQKTIPPPDTFTLMQYAQHQNITREQARGFISRLEREGIVEYVGSFGLKHERHYALKETS